MENEKWRRAAARFFLLAKHVSRLSQNILGQHIRMIFWETFGDISTVSAADTTTHLPALAAAVRAESTELFRILARHPLPDVLVPEAVPWHDRLVAAWEVHRASSDKVRRNAARLALVRLDGCSPPERQERPSRLAEWLEEARKIANGESKWKMKNGKWNFEELEALAALAAWRPAPRVITPSETLREWVDLWQEIQQLKSPWLKEPILRGIAAKALLNLAEADLRGASLLTLPVRELLSGLKDCIRAAAYATRGGWDHISMLDWMPATGTDWPETEMMKLVESWLGGAYHKSFLYRSTCGKIVLQQLIRWNRSGHLARWQIDLLPLLANTIQDENDIWVLWAMAQWSPTAEVFTEENRQNGVFLLQQLENKWQEHRRSMSFWKTTSGWLAIIHLHRVGLATEPPESFRKSYLSAVAKEDEAGVLFLLAQWVPGAEAPAAFHREWRQGWQQRLADKNEVIRQIAAFALLHQVMTANEMAEQLAPDGTGWDRAGQRRWLREFLRSYEQIAGGDEGNNRTVEFMNSLWTKGCLFFRETTRGRGRAEASILGGQGAVFVHPPRDRVSPVEAAGSFTERKAAPVPVPGRSTSLTG